VVSREAPISTKCFTSLLSTLRNLREFSRARFTKSSNHFALSRPSRYEIPPVLDLHMPSLSLKTPKRSRKSSKHLMEKSSREESWWLRKKKPALLTLERAQTAINNQFQTTSNATHADNRDISPGTVLRIKPKSKNRETNGRKGNSPQRVRKGITRNDTLRSIVAAEASTKKGRIQLRARALPADLRVPRGATTKRGSKKERRRKGTLIRRSRKSSAELVLPKNE
jgi:hypothetical protein